MNHHASAEREPPGYLKLPDARVPQTPKGWKLMESVPDHLKHARVYKNDRRGLVVVLTMDPDEPVDAWIHASISHPRRTPSYDELAEMKRLFIGDEHVAYQIFPPRAEHVNYHEHCLHLWSPVGPDPLAESRRRI